jgi:hypothetical protein
VSLCATAEEVAVTWVFLTLAISVCLLQTLLLVAALAAVRWLERFVDLVSAPEGAAAAAVGPAARRETERPSPFHLPLLVGSLADTSRHLELKYSQLSKAGLWRFADSGADEETRDERLQLWKEDIRELQCNNSKWTTQWLTSYGTSGLKALSDTQLAALLDAQPDPRRRNALRDQDYRGLAHARLSPACVALAQRHKPKELVGWKRFLTRPVRTRPTRGTRPTRPSPLRKVRSADYSESPPAPA